MKMRKWLNLIIILIIMSLFGCRTMDGQGSAAGAGTYPLKSTPAAEDTVLLTVVDGTKAGGFDIRRTPVANMPVSTPVSTALGLKQDAATAITEGDVQDIVDDAVAGIPGSTITPDTITPTKAAIAVTADTIAGSGITQSPTYRLATDTEKSTWNAKVDPGDLASATVAHSSTSDSATSAASVDPVKTSGVPGMMSVFEADGTSTLKTGFIGPANSTVNFVYQFPNGIPTPGDTWVAGTALAEQTLPDGTTGTIIPLTHAAGGSSANDTEFGISWDGDTTTAASKNALYDKLASLETQVTDMIAAFSAAGLNSFTFPSSSIYPIYTNDATYTLTVDVTDTSTTYAVNAVNYKLASGEYAAMTNTAGNTWSVTLPTQTDGAYDLRFNAADDKSTPNTGESAVYTDALIIDLTNPSIGVVTPSALTHDGTGVSLSATIASVIETNEDDREWSLYDVTADAVKIDWSVFTGLSIATIPIPADQHTYRVDVRCTDLAGNVGTASSSNIVYEAEASNPDFQWNLDDNTTGTVVAATYGATNGKLLVEANTSDVHTTSSCDSGAFLLDAIGEGFSVNATGAIGNALYSGVFSVEFSVLSSSVGSNTYSTFWSWSSSTTCKINKVSSTSIQVRVGGVNATYNVTDLHNGVCREYRLVCNTPTLTLYEKLSGGSWTQVGTNSTMGATSTAPGGTISFGAGSAEITQFYGSLDTCKFWVTAVTP